MDQIVDYFEPNIKVYTINDQNCVSYVKLYGCEEKKIHQHGFQLQLPPRFIYIQMYAWKKKRTLLEWL